MCGPVTDEDVKTQGKFRCAHEGCHHVFNNKHGLKVHAGKCCRKGVYILDKILAVKEKVGSALRRFKVRWHEYGEKDDTWQTYSSLPPRMIKEFLLGNGIYDHDWPGARCSLCDKPCKNERGVQSHLQYCYFFNTGQKRAKQDFKNRKAEAAAMLEKVKQAQKLRPKVKCEGEDLKNCFLFKYLGSIFAADGSHQHDVTRRIILAKKRCGQLRNIFSSPDVPTATKLSIYKSAVVSLLTYGCEAWALTPKLQARINGSNASCVARITGHSIHFEASARTQTFDIILALRQRKWKWLGHILRQKGPRLIKEALRVQFANGDRSNMLQDMPSFVDTFAQLSKLAADRDVWRAHQPQRRNFNSRSAAPNFKPKYGLRSKQQQGPDTKTSKFHHQQLQVQQNRDNKGKRRDAIHPFFRPHASSATKAKRRKRKKKALTNKQRQAFAREHYRKHHGSGSSVTTTSTTISTSPPTTPTISTQSPTTTPTTTSPTQTRAAKMNQLRLLRRKRFCRHKKQAPTMSTPSPSTPTPATPSPIPTTPTHTSKVNPDMDVDSRRWSRIQNEYINNNKTTPTTTNQNTSTTSTIKTPTTSPSTTMTTNPPTTPSDSPTSTPTTSSITTPTTYTPTTPPTITSSTSTPTTSPTTLTPRTTIALTTSRAIAAVFDSTMDSTDASADYDHSPSRSMADFIPTRHNSGHLLLPPQPQLQSPLLQSPRATPHSDLWAEAVQISFSPSPPSTPLPLNPTLTSIAPTPSPISLTLSLSPTLPPLTSLTLSPILPSSLSPSPPFYVNDSLLLHSNDDTFIMALTTLNNTYVFNPFPTKSL